MNQGFIGLSSWPVAPPLARWYPTVAGTAASGWHKADNFDNPDQENHAPVSYNQALSKWVLNEAGIWEIRVRGTIDSTVASDETGLALCPNDAVANHFSLAFLRWDTDGVAASKWLETAKTGRFRAGDEVFIYIYTSAGNSNILYITGTASTEITFLYLGR